MSYIMRVSYSENEIVDEVLLGGKLRAAIREARAYARENPSDHIRYVSLFKYVPYKRNLDEAMVYEYIQKYDELIPLGYDDI